MSEAVDAMRVAFAGFSAGVANVPPRVALDVAGEGTTLVMPAFLPPDGLATKIVSVFAGNAARGLPTIHGLVALIDAETGRPRAILDGGELTAIRTGAASGLATDLLARPDASVTAILGTGVQARTQALAVAAVRSVEEFRVFGRDPDRRAEFVASLGQEIDTKVSAVGSAGEAVRGADVICAATPATTPVVRSADVTPGAHVNAIGSYRLDMRELDVDLVGRASVFVDSVEAVLEESGELVAAIEAGVTRTSEWSEIGDVVRGEADARRSTEQVTVFKSVGLAAQDAAAAARAFENAIDTGLGAEVDF